MKTHTLASMAALFLAVPVMATAQQSSSSSSQPSGTTPSASSSSSSSTTTASASTQGGIIVQNGTTYTVRDGQATKLDSSSLQSGQMMTSDGKAVSIPSNVTGIEGFTPSPSATTDTTASAQSGVAVHNGVTYLIRNGQATKLDTTSLPSGQMMTWDGQLTAQPQNLRGLEGTSSSSSTQPSATSPGSRSARDFAPGRSDNPPPGQGGLVPGQAKSDTDASSTTSPSPSSSSDSSSRQRQDKDQ